MVKRLVWTPMAFLMWFAAVRSGHLLGQAPPKQTAQQPAKFEASFNQFRGNWTIVKRDGAKLQIETAVEAKAKNSTVTPSPEDWQAFWKEMDAINIWKWEKEYIDKDIVDGQSWNLKFEYRGNKIESSGSNRFPQNFPRYEKALKQLLGKKAG